MFLDMINFYAIYRIKPALDQFIDGLRAGGIFDDMQKYPHLFKKIMCFEDVIIKADVLEKLFLPNFSEKGSTKRQTENRINSFFRDFLLESESKCKKVILI